MRSGVAAADSEGSSRALLTRPPSVAHSVPAADALSRELCRFYYLRAPSCSLLRGGTNDTYVVRERGNTYLARVYGVRSRSTREIEYEVALLFHLAEKGATVCMPVPARDGRFVHSLPLPEGPRQVVLFTHVESHPLSWDSAADCRVVGQAAASMHAASDGFVISHARFGLDAEYLIDASLTAIRPFLDHRPYDATDLTRIARRLRGRVAAAVEAGLDWGVCHGDLSVRTVAALPGGRWFAFGFDLCAPGWRAFDLAAVHRAAVARGKHAIWESFLDGYRGVRPLMEQDVAAAPLFEAVRELWRLGLYARNVPEWGTSTLSDPYLDRKLAYFRKWDREAARR